MNQRSRPALLAPGHRRTVEIAFGVDVVVNVVDPQLDCLVQHGNPVFDARSSVAPQGDLGDHETGLAQLPVSHPGMILRILVVPPSNASAGRMLDRGGACHDRR